MSRGAAHGADGSPSLLDLRDAAVAMAREAGAVTLRYFGDVLHAESKSDGTPVTLADREAETLLRDRIGSQFPDHSILGEEFGELVGTAPVRWILDPIDGTRAFMKGVPLYAVLVGIEADDRPAVGVAHFPALGETLAAAVGEGCSWWARGSSSAVPAQVSGVEALDASLLLTTDIERILESELSPGWRRLAEGAEVVRGWGDAYGHALVATGRAEIMVDPVLSPWDAAPLLTIVTEAGGRFTDLAGHATIQGGSGVSTNGSGHERVLEMLRGG